MDWGQIEALDRHPLFEIGSHGVSHSNLKFLIEGKAEGMKRLLARRFGPLPPWAEQRIAAASIAQLDAWIDGLLDAESLAALIAPKGGAEPTGSN